VGDLAGAAVTFNEPNIGLLLHWMLPPFILDQMKQAMVDAAKACNSKTFSSAQFGRQDVMLPNLIERTGRATRRSRLVPATSPWAPPWP
jgi:beta-glucosidase